MLKASTTLPVCVAKCGKGTAVATVIVGIGVSKVHTHSTSHRVLRLQSSPWDARIFHEDRRGRDLNLSGYGPRHDSFSGWYPTQGRGRIL